MVELSFLEVEVREAVSRAVGAIERGLGEKLQSVLLVGVAVPPSRLRPGGRVELLAVVSDLPVPSISNLAHQLAAVAASRVQVHVLTERELLRSADVFTLMLADYGARHVVLLGTDPLVDLHYTRGELRRSIEQTLRADGWRMRDAVLRSGPNDRAGGSNLEGALRESYERLVVVAHHVLVLLGEQVPATEPELLQRLADRAGGGAVALAAVGARFHAAAADRSSMASVAELLDAVDAVTAFVDAIGAGD